MRKLKFWALSLAVVMCFFCLTACGGGQSISDKWNDLWNNDTETPYTPLPHDPVPVEFNSVSFSKDSWLTISRISESGRASEYYTVGDEKRIELSTGELITVLILGFNHDDLADGTGKAGITLGMKDCLDTFYPMDADKKALSWADCSFRNEILPLIFSQLPIELKLRIKTVNKVSNYAEGDSPQDSKLAKTIDALFLFSEMEIFGSLEYGTEDGKLYEYWRIYSDEADRIKYHDMTPSDWFLRTYCLPGVVRTVSFTGSIYNISADSSNIILFGFCI